MSWNRLSGWAVAALVVLAGIGSAQAAEKAAPAATQTPAATGSAGAAKVELPKAAAAALKTAYKKAETGAITTVEMGGVNLFRVELTRKSLAGYVLVSADGTIVFLETVYPAALAPKELTTATEKAVEGAAVASVTMRETYFDAKGGNLTPVQGAKQREFDVRVVKGDQEGTLVLDSKGNVAKPVAWKPLEKKEEKKNAAKEPQPAATDTAAQEAK